MSECTFLGLFIYNILEFSTDGMTFHIVTFCKCDVSTYWSTVDVTYPHGVILQM